MDHHVDRVVLDIVQPVCLHDLQALVGEGRRIDRDLRPHVPRRVTQRLLRRDHGQLGRAGVEERSARCGQQEPGDRTGRLAREALPDRGVLRIDRPQPGQRAREGVPGIDRRAFGRPCASERHDEVAAGDEWLLVGRGDDFARGERGEHRAEADDAACTDDDEVHVVARGQLLERVRPADPFRARGQLQGGGRPLVGDADRGRMQERHLFREDVGGPPGRQRDDSECLGMAGEHLDRLAADGPGTAEERDPDRSLGRPATPLRAAPRPGVGATGRSRRHTGSRSGRRTGTSRSGRGSRHGRG